jgi:hypothetical protein
MIADGKPLTKVNGKLILDERHQFTNATACSHTIIRYL